MDLDCSTSLDKILRIACTSECTVLITGETGTGKSVLAKKIHEMSPRRGGPFIKVNLATLHEGVVESELFGHERGAFTGADQRRTGKLELAHKGTVFLDEIGDIPLKVQARLLEFLQSRTITAVGGNQETHLDVRVIAATHQDLPKVVAQREFREDLFHRLRVVSVPLRPLRERQEELDKLVRQTLLEICRQFGRSRQKVGGNVLSRFQAYPWPGNLRELRNVLEFAVYSSDGKDIEVEDLPGWFLRDTSGSTKGIALPLLGVAEVPLTVDFYGTLGYLEKEYLKRALHHNGGRISRTARQIGISKTTLLRRLKAYDLISQTEN